MDTWLLLALVAALAFAPIAEVRGAIPLVLAFSDTPLELVLGLVISVLSNACVPFAAFGLLDYAERLVSSRRTPVVIRRAYSYVISLGRKRASKLKTGSYIALALFVGIPFPVTGAWTGSLVAFVLGMDRRLATRAIVCGVLVASIIVMAASALGLEVLKRLFAL